MSGDLSKPLLVGLQNPYGADPDFALYPYPKKATGAAIVKMLQAEVPGTTSAGYLRAFDRMNLWTGELPTGAGRAEKLRAAGEEVLGRAMGRLDCVLFGRVVWDAVMQRPAEPFFSFLTLNQMTRFWHFPHPSGANRSLNAPGVRTEFGQVLARIMRSEYGEPG